MSIIRKAKQHDKFTIVPNSIPEDDSISWKAKGLMLYLLSRPDDWEIHVNHLSSVSKDGRDSTASTLKELIDVGYIRRTRKLDEHNKFDGYDYEVYTEKATSKNGKSVNGKSVNGKSVNGKSVNGKSVNGKSVTTNTEDTNTELNNTENTNSDFGNSETHPSVTANRERLKASMNVTSEKLPFESDAFKTQWELFKTHLHEKGKRATTTQLNTLGSILIELSGGSESKAIKVIEQAIKSGWGAFYPLKEEKQSATNNSRSNRENRTPFVDNDDRWTEIQTPEGIMRIRN